MIEMIRSLCMVFLIKGVCVFQIDHQVIMPDDVEEIPFRLSNLSTLLRQL